MGHAQLSTTERYLHPLATDVIETMLAFYRKRAPSALVRQRDIAGEPRGPLRHGPAMRGSALTTPSDLDAASRRRPGGEIRAPRPFPPRPFASSWPTTVARRWRW